jgi:hypothetical protein
MSVHFLIGLPTLLFCRPIILNEILLRVCSMVQSLLLPQLLCVVSSEYFHTHVRFEVFTAVTMPSSGMLRHVALVRTDVSEEHSASRMFCHFALIQHLILYLT